MYKRQRLIDATAALDYPPDRLQIQLLDDSTDDTTSRAAVCVARQIAGPVTVEEISGNVDIRGVDGNVAVGRARHNANVFYATGQVTLGRVDGDVSLRGALSPGDHAVVARGDIIVRWPANAPLNLVAAGRQIDNRLPLQDIIEKDGRLTARLGSDGANLTLSADGRVILKEGDPDEKWE